MSTAGWAAMRREGALARWQALCGTDAALNRRLPGAAARFAVEQEGLRFVVEMADGRATVSEGGEADTTFSAPAGTWAKFLEPVPPRHHHNLFAMRMRATEFRAAGDELVWAQHCHLLRRALDLAPRVRRVVACLRPRNEGARVTESGTIRTSIQGPHRRAAAAAGERGRRRGLARGRGQHWDTGALAGIVPRGVV